MEERGWGGAITLGNIGTNQLVAVSENDWLYNKNTFGKPIKQTFADKLMHELVGHAIPNAVSTDTGNAVEK